MELMKPENIASNIPMVEGLQVMLDADIAPLYQTKTKYITRAIKRNSSRFPELFAFQLTKSEYENLRIQSGTSTKKHGGRPDRSYVFPEQGVAMHAAILQTDIAIRMSIWIREALVQTRKLLQQYSAINDRLFSLGRKQLQKNKQVDQVFRALERKELPLDKGIFSKGKLSESRIIVD